MEKIELTPAHAAVALSMAEAVSNAGRLVDRSVGRSASLSSYWDAAAYSPHPTVTRLFYLIRLLTKLDVWADILGSS
jgi:hypothetical protein